MVRMNPHLRAFVQWSSFGMLAATALATMLDFVIHDHAVQFLVSGAAMIGLILVVDWIFGKRA